MSDDRNETNKIMKMDILKRFAHFLGWKTLDEVCHAIDAAVLAGKYVAYYDVLEKFERHDGVPVDELRDYIELYIQLKLRELRNRK